MAGYSPAVVQALLDGPADTPPNGKTSDFNVQPPYDHQGIAVVVVCLFLVTTTGFLRAYSRIRVMKTVLLEDYLALAGFGIYVGTVWAMLDFINMRGFFVHQWNIRLSTMLDLTYRMYIFSVCYSGSLGFAKAAILLEWNRIFVPRGMRNRFFWAACTLLVINTLLYISASIAVICSCTPPRKLWNPFIAGTCLDRKTVDTTAAAFNLVTDIAVFVLPQRKIWSLQMTTSRKIGLSVVFSFGLLSCASAIGRIHATVNTIYPAPGASGDVSYTVSPLLIWCLAEMTCVFLVFCIPMVPGAFSNKTLLGRAIASVWSWTRMTSSRMSSRKTSDSIFQKSWPNTLESTSQDRGHRLPDDDDQTIGLADLRYSRITKGPGVGSYRRPAEPSDTAILKTTEFEQHEDSASKTSGDPFYERQHPWTEPYH